MFRVVVTGLLLSGITAVVFHLSGALDFLTHLSPSRSPKSFKLSEDRLNGESAFSEVEQVALFQKKTSVEEEMKATIKELEAGFDTFIETVSPEDTSLTKEVRKVHCVSYSIMTATAFRTSADSRP